MPAWLEITLRLFAAFVSFYGFITLIFLTNRLRSRREANEEGDTFFADFLECLKWPAIGIRALREHYSKRHLP